MKRPTHHELIDLALERLEPSRREAVERWLQDDVALAQRARAIREHLRSYDALPASPPPPPFEAVAQDLPAHGARPVRARPSPALLRPIGAVAVGVAALLLFVLFWSTPARTPVPVERIGDAGAGLVVVRAGRVRPDRGLRAGDTIEARHTGELRLGERALGQDIRVVLAAGSRLEIPPQAMDTGVHAVALSRGRAFFQVETHGGFAVETPAGRIRVVGTAFEVVVDGPSLDVRVASGTVEVDRHRVEAGRGIRDGTAYPLREAPGAFFRRPVLELRAPASLEAEGVADFTLTLRNPGMVPMEIPGPEGVRVALWLEVVDPAGKVVDVPVEIVHADLAPGRRLTLGARQQTAFDAPVAGPFRDRGVYRCRAMYRPEGEPPLVSETVSLEVR